MASTEIKFRNITGTGVRVNDATGIRITKAPAQRLGRNGFRKAGYVISSDTDSAVEFETTYAKALVTATTRAAVILNERAAEAELAYDEHARRQFPSVFAILDAAPATPDPEVEVAIANDQCIACVSDNTERAHGHLRCFDCGYEHPLS